MLRHLGEIGTVTVVPAHTTAEEVLAMNPDGVFLSNGPGDPEEAGPIVDELPKLLGRCRSSASASAIKCCRSRSGAGPTR